MDWREPLEYIYIYIYIYPPTPLGVSKACVRVALPLLYPPPDPNSWKITPPPAKNSPTLQQVVFSFETSLKSRFWETSMTQIVSSGWLGSGANRDSHLSGSAQIAFWKWLGLHFDPLSAWTRCESRFSPFPFSKSVLGDPGSCKFLENFNSIYIYIQYIRRRLTNMPERDELPHKQILAKLSQKNIGVGGMA